MIAFSFMLMKKLFNKFMWWKRVKKKEKRKVFSLKRANLFFLNLKCCHHSHRQQLSCTGNVCLCMIFIAVHKCCFVALLSFCCEHTHLVKRSAERKHQALSLSINTVFKSNGWYSLCGWMLCVFCLEPRSVKWSTYIKCDSLPDSINILLWDVLNRELL